MRPHRPYIDVHPPRCYGLMPVAGMLAIFCKARWFGVGGANAADVISRLSTDTLDHSEKQIVEALRDGSIKGWAVPQDGGRSVRLRSQLWSGSEGMDHLVAGAADPMRWGIPDASATH